MIESINAITLATHDMAQAVRFYQTLGFDVTHGGAEDKFTSFRVGTGFLNLTAQPVDRQWSWWGRTIFHVADVDALYRLAVTKGLEPHTMPRDAEWGKHYLHITDSDGHELSFARPLSDATG